MYPATTNFLTVCSRFLAHSLGLSGYTIRSSANNDNLTSAFPVFNTFNFFLFIIVLVIIPRFNFNIDVNS